MPPAAGDPFAVQELPGGHMVVARGGEGRCGEGKCGGAAGERGPARPARACENVSCYAVPAQEMSEAELGCAVAEEADCPLLLDVNNVHVNAVNFGFDPCAYSDRIPPARVAREDQAPHAGAGHR